MKIFYSFFFLWSMVCNGWQLLFWPKLQGNPIILSKTQLATTSLTSSPVFFPCGSCRPTNSQSTPPFTFNIHELWRSHDVIGQKTPVAEKQTDEITCQSTEGGICQAPIYVKIPFSDWRGISKRRIQISLQRGTEELHNSNKWRKIVVNRWNLSLLR